MTGGAEGADSGEAERHPDCPAIAKSARLSKAAQGRLRAPGQLRTSQSNTIRELVLNSQQYRR